MSRDGDTGVPEERTSSGRRRQRESVPVTSNVKTHEDLLGPIRGVELLEVN